MTDTASQTFSSILAAAFTRRAYTTIRSTQAEEARDLSENLRAAAEDARSAAGEARAALAELKSLAAHVRATTERQEKLIAGLEHRLEAMGDEGLASP